MKKIFDLKDLSNLLKKKHKNKKIVLCHGVFDLIHIGHIEHFEQAKKYGDILIVSLTADKFVKNKGPNRPAFNQNIRLKTLSAINSIDYICLSNSDTAINTINTLRPNFYCKGLEYKNHKNDVTGEIKNEINVLKKNKGKIVYTSGTISSSSKLLNRYFDNISNLQADIINKIKKKSTLQGIKDIIDKFKNNTALVVGETIIDEYNFTEALGKSGKEPNLVLRHLSSELYIGGAAATAINLSNFAKKVLLLTFLGENSDYLNFIKKNLPSNVEIHFLKKKNSPTIVKKRYIDLVSKNKLLGVYKINDEPLDKAQEKDLNNKFDKLTKRSNLIVVSDYGHGLIPKSLIKKLNSSKQSVSLNAQINASNVSFHNLNDYKNIECVVINERELRHQLRNRNSDIKLLLKKISLDQKYKNIIVTRGSQGAIMFDNIKKKMYFCPAFANKIVDKVGSGDSMLSLVALSIKNKLDKNLTLLIGSLAAADSVEHYANKFSFTKIKLLKNLEHLFK
jgi:rfaE bifunctional protein kinase chain/domain/rfaE bifunctional protein nucleotidyltransferase chain/domain